MSKVQPQEDQLQTDLASTASESRFLCLKLMTDVLVTLLSDETVYNPIKNDAISQKLDSLIASSLLPLANQLLCEAEPAPFYGQRLLSAILDCNLKLCKGLPQQTVLSICDYYKSDDANLNKHTIKAMRHVLAILPFDVVHEQEIVPRTLQLIHTMLRQNQELFLDLLLDINQQILQKLSDSIKTANPP